MKQMRVGNTETKEQRIEERLKVLRAIRDGGEYSKADKVLRPLSFGSLITIEYEDAERTKIAEVALTNLGEQFIFFYEAKYKK